MTRPDISDCVAFLAVAEHGGFRQAAQQGGISASSLSEAVRRLETALRLRLFNRTTRTVVLTEAGQRLLERLRPALGEVRQALDHASISSDQATGTLRLNVPSIVARHILPDLAVRFLSAHPGVRLDITVQDELVDVLALGFDAGVRYVESIAQDLIAVRLGPHEQRFVAAASPDYLARHGVPHHPAELAQHDCIGHRFVNGVLAVWTFQRGDEVMRIAPQGPLKSSSVNLDLAAAIGGLGIVYSFEEDIRPALQLGQLAPVLQDWWQRFPGPSLYFQGGLYMPPPLRAFVDFVKADTLIRDTP